MCRRIASNRLVCALAAFLLTVFSVRAASLPAGFIDVVVGAGFTNASSMAIAPDGRVFVCQQNGLVRVVKNGLVLPVPFISLGVNTANERGLLGITLDPGFGTNNFVYLHYTTNAPVAGNFVQRVSRFTANGDVAAVGSEMVLVETDPFLADRELGGGLGFGADGMLYIGAGVRELGGGLGFGADGMLYIGAGQASSSSQTTNSLFGKILRIQPDGGIPADNPFFGQNTGKNRATWALGLRNPFVIAFQRGTGRLFINDVGGFSREEINEGFAGANYGWPTCEGNCSVPNAAFRNPLYSFGHGPSNAITGGVFYNPPSALYPTQYVGKYFFGDLATANIQVLDPATTNVSPFAAKLVGNLVSLQVGPDGALYYLVQSVSPAGGGLVGKIIPGAQTLFPLGSAWKYLDTGITNISPNWTQLAFDDSTWSNGVAQFGYGDGGEATLIRSARASDGSRIITTYFRKAFVPTNTAFYSHFVVSLVRDDGAIVYLNGTEVFRSNMPTGAVNSATLAPVAMATLGIVDDESATFGAIVDRNLLVPGTNLLAVELHQQSATSTDVSFDLAFYALSSVPVLTVEASGGNIVLYYPASFSAFILESNSTLAATGWDPVSNPAVDVGGVLQVTLPAEGEQQFFRLRRP
jgi:glucose/arabinose dehydrogenase